MTPEDSGDIGNDIGNDIANKLADLRYRVQYQLPLTLAEERWLVEQVSIANGLGPLPARRVRCNNCNCTGKVNVAAMGRIMERCSLCAGSGYLEAVEA